MSEEKPVAYILVSWAFDEMMNHYLTFDLEEAKAWGKKEHPYGYYDYEEIEIYQGEPLE